MDFSVPAPLTAMLNRARKFLVDEVYPLERAYLGQPFTSLLPQFELKRARVRELGLWAPQIAREHGGAGLSVLEHAQLSELLGMTPIGHYLFNCQAPDSGNMELLAQFGTDEQKQRWLGPLVRGEIRSCFSMTEPEHAGSNPVQMSTSAVRDGDDYVINGHKWFTSSADGARFAIVMAVTNPDAAPHQRASQIIVPCETPGFELVRNIPVMGHAGDGYASHSEIVYRDCRVPRANLLGSEGGGFALAQERLGPGRIHHCMRWIGICERALDLMCRRAATRELSPGVLLGSKGAVQTWIAESRAEIDAARLMVLKAAWTIDLRGAHAAREEISTIKFFVAGVLGRGLDRAIQAHGAAGMTDETPLALWYAQERGARIYDGPDEVHKMVLARRILKRYGLESA